MTAHEPKELKCQFCGDYYNEEDDCACRDFLYDTQPPEGDPE